MVCSASNVAEVLQWQRNLVEDDDDLASSRWPFLFSQSPHHQNDQQTSPDGIDNSAACVISGLLPLHYVHAVVSKEEIWRCEVRANEPPCFLCFVADARSFSSQSRRMAI